MDPSAENLPQGQIINRTNAINIRQPLSNSVSPDGIVRRINAGNTELPKSHKIDRENGSSWGSKVAAIAALGVTLGGGAAVIDEMDGDSAHASAFEQQDKNTTNVESAVQSHTAETQDSKNVAIVKTQENLHDDTPLFETVFHDLTPRQQQEARKWVEYFKIEIKKKPGYEKEHRMIPQQYKEIITDAAKDYGLPPEMLYGIIAIENGGGTDRVHPVSEATGVAQFLPDTARQYGLIVNANQDQRKDPVLSIEAAARYLQVHKGLLGDDIGLTIWSYHAGIGNVNKALSVYFQDKYGEDIGFDNGDKNEKKARELIKKDKLDYYKLVSNPAVREKVISELADYSETYVPSVLALIQLEEENGDQEFDLGNGLRVAVPKDTFPGR
ncbi:MAG: transglycosylase SLT domain-containing protein [Candidatus Levybacteria bacterium]|nr:transglycosylase SLT domain-containing protein [Candidatus Levybacteria bacterium]